MATRHSSFYKKDVRNLNSDDSSWFGEIDVVFHNAASKKNICLIDPAADMQVNGIGVLKLLELMNSCGVRHLVHASTGSVYGRPVKFPTVEETPFAPVSHYGVSKAAAEHYVSLYSFENKISAVVLRYFHVFGPRQESNEFGGVVSIFLRQANEGGPLTVFGDGNQIRCFTHVRDVVSANLEAATRMLENRQGAPVEHYNLASPNRVAISDLAQIIRNRFSKENRELEIVFKEPLEGDIHFFDVDSAKASKELGINFSSDFLGDLDTLIEQYINEDTVSHRQA